MKRKNEAAKMLKGAYEAGTLSSIKYGPVPDQTSPSPCSLGRNAEEGKYSGCEYHQTSTPSPAAMRAAEALHGSGKWHDEQNWAEWAARIIDRETGASEIRTAAKALLSRLDRITTDSFSTGGDHDAREALRAALGKDA